MEKCKAPDEQNVYLLYLSTGQHNLARNEDQKHNLGLDHTIDQAREELRATLEADYTYNQTRNVPQARTS